MRKYGWKRDIPDFRDKKFKAIRKEPKVLPTRVDLRKFCTQIENQGDLGSCTANAIGSAMEFLEKRVLGKSVDFSRLFIYYNERKKEGNIDEDSGAQIRTGMKVIAQYGACLEKTWPYDIDQFAVEPSQEAYQEGEKYHVISYHRIDTDQESLYNMKYCLADGYPFVFGFSVFDSFESNEVSQTGIMPMPERSESMLGGHAVLAVGYDDIKGMFLIRNSWGEDWGQGGYFWMPYEFIENNNYAEDFWTVRKIE